MAGPDDYCELCDLRLSQCPHGMPKPVVEPETPKPLRTPRAPRKKAPAKSAARTTTAKTVTTQTSPSPRKWTPPTDFVPHIVAVLDEAGGSLETETALAKIEERLGDQLLPGDRERSPQGDLRWRTAARKARRELVVAGVINADRPGVWRLNN